MPTRYDKEFKQNIINLYKQGESAAQLAREYGIGYSTVHKWIQGQAKIHWATRPPYKLKLQHLRAKWPPDFMLSRVQISY